MIQLNSRPDLENQDTDAYTGGTLRQLKRSSKKICHMMGYACDFEIAQNRFELEYRSRVKILK